MKTLRLLRNVFKPSLNKPSLLLTSTKIRARSPESMQMKTSIVFSLRYATNTTQESFKRKVKCHKLFSYWEVQEREKYYLIKIIKLKESQCALIERAYNVHVHNTGALLREEVKKGGKLGAAIKKV